MAQINGMELGYSYDQLEVGMSASFTKTITETDVYLFAGISGDFEPPLACAAKVESSCLRCFCPQDGHSISATSVLRRTSFSNLVSQSSQRYS